MRRIILKSFLICTSIWLASCATQPAVDPVDPAVRTTLAPTGTLRIAGYRGSPTSLLVNNKGEYSGVTHDAGQALAQRLGVPVQIIVFDRIAQVLDALKNGEADMTFTNASPTRQASFAFTKPLLSQELGYLVPASGKLQSVEAVDAAGVLIGVSQGSSSQATLGAAYKAAKLKLYPNLDVAKAALLKGEIDGFATNKGNLNEMREDLAKTAPFKVLEGRWGMEHFGIGIPKERASAIPFVQAFADELKRSGALAQMAQRAGLRDIVIAP